MAKLTTDMIKAAVEKALYETMAISPVDIGWDETLYENGLDSLDVVELVMEVENNLDEEELDDGVMFPRDLSDVYEFTGPIKDFPDFLLTKIVGA